MQHYVIEKKSTFGVFTMIPMWGSIHLGPQEKGKRGLKTG